MAVYNNINPLVYDSIQECLDMAKNCLDKPKNGNTNACYGMPAAILLCSAMDAIGSFFDSQTDNGQFKSHNEDLTGLRNGHHLKVFYSNFEPMFTGKYEISKDNFSAIFIRIRNNCVHNNGLLSDVFLRKGGETLLKKEGENSYLNLELLHEFVSSCFNEFKNEHPLNNSYSKDENGYTGDTITQIESCI